MSSNLATPTCPLNPATPTCPLNPSTPTKAQTDSLARLNAPLPHPVSTPIIDVLSNAFTLCRSQWVSDFLFNTSVTPLSVMTSMNMNFAICSNSFYVGVDRADPNNPLAPNSPRLFDTSAFQETVFVPAFSVGPVNVGFGAESSSALSCAEWGMDTTLPNPQGFCAQLRFARNDATGELMFVRDHEAADCFQIDFFRAISSSVRRRQFMMLNRTSFLKALQNQPAVDLVQAASQSCDICCTSLEYRSCPTCSLFHMGDCKCELRLKMAKHPLDFSNFMENMASFVGVYEGSAVCSVRTGSKPHLHFTISNRLHIDGHCNRELIDRLSQWAIKDTLKNVKEQPLKHVMPYVRTLVGSLDTLDDDGDHSHSDYAISTIAASAVTVMGSRPPVEAGGINLQETTPIIDEMAMGNIFEIPELSTDVSGFQFAHTLPEVGNQFVVKPHHSPRAANMTETYSNAARTDGTVPMSRRDGASGEISAASNDAGCVRSGDMNWTNGRDLLKTVGSTVSSDGSVHRLVGAGSGSGAGHNEVTGAEQAGNEQAGAEQAGNDQTGNDQEGGDTRAHDVLREGDSKDEPLRRAELRRRRNREAAARSNLRRKVVNDTLKKELHESQHKAASLRARELRLREENLRLRKQVASLFAM